MSSCVPPLIFEMRLFFEPVISRAPPPSLIQTFSFPVAHDQRERGARTRRPPRWLPRARGSVAL